MALRLRRDVQKASYYVWFLGAEEAKGLRGERVINSVLPYLIDRSRGQEPLKVTLQVSHKGIKILQGSSKHFIPHSAITSSVQTDDIVACVLLLYNPATKCPLHVHAYRCDSESTAETLHQQLQILINRPENQKRFEELETRLGILPPLPTSGNKSTSSATAHISNKETQPHSQKLSQHYQSQQQQPQKHQQRRHDTSPKRFSSSLGSDTGNSTRESECSEENSGSSPISRSPPIVKPAVVPLPQPNNELFDSLAAELRAKLNGNGPPILLPPRDYDTVHRSKGNLTAIELRRCRNALIVGGTKNAPNKLNAANGKQVSSRGSSGIGSDLAPSPERQELNSSSDEEHWSNEADNSVIALKPSQIAMERSAPIIPHHPPVNRKSVVKTPEDSYLRDLPAKPYTPRAQQSSARDVKAPENRSKTPSTTSWSREDEIKPIIMRPTDYDVKFHRALQHDEKKAHYLRSEREHPKLRDTDKYNEINRLLNKKLTLDAIEPDLDHQHHPRVHHMKHKKLTSELDEYDDSDLPNEKLPLRATSSNGYVGKENLTDKQKFMEYNSKQKSYAVEEAQKYGRRHRYVDPADLPFDATHHVERVVNRSPQRSDRREFVEPTERRRRLSREREPDTERYGRSSERNPYREPESIPYIKSMEKMMKSTAMHYKSHGAGMADGKVEGHSKIAHHSKSYPQHDNGYKHERGDYNGYAPSAGSRDGNRYKEAKEKMRPLERTGSRHNLVENERDYDDYRPRRRGSIEQAEHRPHIYRQDWSDEERLDGPMPPSPPIGTRSRSRSRDQWEQDIEEILPPRKPLAKEPYAQREYARDGQRERSSSKLSDHHVREKREPSPERYREQRRYESREREPRESHHRARDHSREYHSRRDYSPDERSVSDYRPEYPTIVDKKQPHHNGAPPIASAKSLSNLAKGYRHSYAEPVFARGRVGLAAVNPY